MNHPESLTGFPLRDETLVLPSRPLLPPAFHSCLLFLHLGLCSPLFLPPSVTAPAAGSHEEPQGRKARSHPLVGRANTQQVGPHRKKSGNSLEGHQCGKGTYMH